MTSTRKRPPSKGKPTTSHPAHPTPPPNPDSDNNYDTHYQQFIQEWHAILPEPPLSTEQLRQEYDDALSFLLLLESRINHLEQSEYAAWEAAQTGQPPTVAPIKLVYVSARSRSAKERNKERLARRSERAAGPAVIIQPQEFIPPYVADLCPNPLLLYEFFAWAARAWNTSDRNRSLSQADQAATMDGLRQVVRCLNNYMQVGAAQ